jgi:GAF domain-containing protein
MTVPDQAAVDPRHAVADLQRRLDERGAQQAAMTEVLRVINGSAGDLAPVFDAMLEKAVALCGAKFGVLFLYDGKEAFRLAADRNLPPAFARAVRDRSFSIENNTGARRIVESHAPLHITDMLSGPDYAAREPLRTMAVELGGVRSMVAFPLLKKDELIGIFSIYRREPGGFAENQIALVTAFAEQAVIAIENARLITETREALEQGGAAAEVHQPGHGSGASLSSR